MQQCYTVVSAAFEAACKIESLSVDNPASRLPRHINRIDRYERPCCGAVLTWANESPTLPV